MDQLIDRIPSSVDLLAKFKDYLSTAEYSLVTIDTINPDQWSELRSLRASYGTNDGWYNLNRLDIFVRANYHDLLNALAILVDKSLYPELFQDVLNAIQGFSSLQSEKTQKEKFVFPKPVAKRLDEHLISIRRIFDLWN